MKLKSTVDHRVKFHGAQPTELEDLALKWTSAVKRKSAPKIIVSRRSN